MAQLYILAVTLLMGARDGYNYRIFGKPVGRYSNIQGWLNYWHWMGSIIFVMVVAPVAYIAGWQCLLAAAIIRVSVYDIAYNKYASVSIGHLGTEAKSDLFFSKIFGKNGAMSKAGIFMLLLLLLNFLKMYFEKP